MLVSGLSALVSEGIIHMTKRLKLCCFYVHISISQVNIKPISISNLISRKKNCNPIEKGHSSAHDHVTCFLCIIIPHSHNNKISRFVQFFLNDGQILVVKMHYFDSLDLFSVFPSE